MGGVRYTHRRSHVTTDGNQDERAPPQARGACAAWRAWSGPRETRRYRLPVAAASSPPQPGTAPEARRWAWKCTPCHAAFPISTRSPPSGKGVRSPRTDWPCVFVARQPLSQPPSLGFLVLPTAACTVSLRSTKGQTHRHAATVRADACVATRRSLGVERAASDLCAYDATHPLTHALQSKSFSENVAKSTTLIATAPGRGGGRFLFRV